MFQDAPPWGQGLSRTSPLSPRRPNTRLCTQYTCRKKLFNVKFFSNHQKWKNSTPSLTDHRGPQGPLPHFLFFFSLLPLPHLNGCLSPHCSSRFLSLSAALEHVGPRAWSVACFAFPSLTMSPYSLGSPSFPVGLPGVPLLGNYLLGRSTLGARHLTAITNQPAVQHITLCVFPHFRTLWRINQCGRDLWWSPNIHFPSPQGIKYLPGCMAALNQGHVFPSLLHGPGTESWPTGCRWQRPIISSKKIFLVRVGMCPLYFLLHHFLSPGT